MRTLSECASSVSRTGIARCSDDHAMVQMLIDKVDRAAGDLDAVVEGLRLRIEAGKGGQQRGMDIQNAIGKCGDKLRREQAHIAGQADQVYVVLSQARDYVGIVLGALAALGNKERRGQAEFFGGLQSARFGDIRDDDGDLDALEPPGANRLGDGEKVRAAAGEQDAEAKGPILRSEFQDFPQGLKPR